MAWQDWVISVGQIILAGALVPTIKHQDKPPLATSLTTATIIGIISCTFLTLHLWFSAGTASISSAGWFLISYQKYRQKNN